MPSRQVQRRLPRFDDFCLDEHTGVAYVTTRGANIVDRVSLEPAGPGAAHQRV